jgi:hypothetical protein
MNYDIDRDWPAPGWNLGFGKLAGIGVYIGGMLIDGDGTRHPYVCNITIYNWGTNVVGHTTDGTFIDYSYTTGTNGIMLYGQASRPDGTRIDYTAANGLKRILQDDKVTERTAYTYGPDSQRLINYQPSLSGGQGCEPIMDGRGRAHCGVHGERIRCCPDMVKELCLPGCTINFQRYAER